MAGTGLSEQRRNYATNPSFEVNTTGWTPVGTSSINRSTTRAQVGTSSGLVTFGAGGGAGQGASIAATGLSVGQQYTASAWMWVPAASMSASPALWLFSGGPVIATVVPTADTWVRVSITWTATSSTHTVGVLNGATATAGQTAYIDGLLVERASSAGDYFDGATADSDTSTTLGATIYDWTGAAHASQSVQSLVIEAFTITATVEAEHVPPRVRIDIEAAASTGISSVTVTRTNPSGRTGNVRTENGSPLPLVVSETTRVGTVYDYEMPYGQPVVYSTTNQPTVLTEPVTVDELHVWLIHPGVPARSMRITLMRGTLEEENEDVEAGVFFPLGRRNAVVISDGRRKAPSGSLVVDTETPTETAAMRDLLADAFPLLLNVPPSTGLEIETAYVHVGAVRRTRPSDIGSDPTRRWLLPVQVVDRPVGGSQSQRTWQDVLDAHATWQDVTNARATWADVLAPTS